MQTRTHSPTRYHVFHDWFSIICTVFVPIYHWASMFFTFGSCLSFQYDNDQTCFFLWFFPLLCMCFNTLTQCTQHEKTCQNVIFLSLYIVFDVGSTFAKFHQVWNFFIFVILVWFPPLFTCFSTLPMCLINEKTCQNMFFIFLIIILDVGSTFVQFWIFRFFFIFSGFF